MNIYDTDLKQGRAKITGKGDKQRVVPLGKQAVFWTDKYLKDVRLKFLRKRRMNTPCGWGLRENVRTLTGQICPGKAEACMENYHHLIHERIMEQDYHDLGRFDFNNDFLKVLVHLYLKKSELSKKTFCEQIVLFICDGNEGEATGFIKGSTTLLILINERLYQTVLDRIRHFGNVTGKQISDIDKTERLVDRIHAIADMMSLLEDLEGVRINPRTIACFGKMIVYNILRLNEHLQDRTTL